MGFFFVFSSCLIFLQFLNKKRKKKKQKEKKKKKQLLSSLFLPHEFGILGGTVMSGPFQCAKLGATPLALQKFVIKK